MLDFFLNHKNEDEIIFLDIHKSRKDLINDSLKISAVLEKENLKNIQIYLESTYSFIATLFGCFRNNIKPTLLLSKLDLNDSFFVDEKFFNECIESKLPSSKPILLKKESSFFLKTSGSSGESKNVEKTLGEMILEAKFLKDFFKIDSSNTFFSSVSHQHLFGLTFKVFVALLSRSKIISKQLNYPELILSQEFTNGILITSPALLKRLNEYENIKTLKNASMILTAGSSLPSSLKDSLMVKIGKNIVEIYGSSETGVIAYKEKNYKPFLPVVLKENKRGSLDISSPWCKPFSSNDGVLFLKDGFELLGRLDRIIKLEDKRVSLVSIENYFLTHPFIKDVYVNKHFEYKRLVALLVLNNEGVSEFRKVGKIGISKELKNFLKKKFDGVFLVRYFKILDELPFNEQGKITDLAFKNVFLNKINQNWETLNIENNSGSFLSTINVGSFYFSGHFSSFPLTPGFVQLGFVYELAKKINIDTKSLKEIEQIKFHNFLRPGQEIRVDLKFENSKLLFKIFANGEVCASGRIKSV